MRMVAAVTQDSVVMARRATVHNNKEAVAATVDSVAMVLKVATLASDLVVTQASVAPAVTKMETKEAINRARREVEVVCQHALLDR